MHEVHPTVVGKPLGPEVEHQISGSLRPRVEPYPGVRFDVMTQWSASRISRRHNVFDQTPITQDSGLNRALLQQLLYKASREEVNMLNMQECPC